MANLKAGMIITMTIALMLVGILLPIGLSDIVDYNGTYTNSSNTSQVLGRNTTVGTLVGTIIPIMAIIGIVLGFVSVKNSRN